MDKETSVPTSAEKRKKQKPDTVLPQRGGTTAWQLSTVLSRSESGTTVVGADVKNYIRPYYRGGAVLAWWATVVQFQGSGTTVGTYDTTAPQYGTTAHLGAVLPRANTAAGNKVTR